MTPESAPRFIVRRRAAGFSVWDGEQRLVASTHGSADAAERAAKRLSAAPPMRTYGLTYYLEVDATSEADAIARSRKFLAPSYRENWEPTEITRFDPEDA